MNAQTNLEKYLGQLTDFHTSELLQSHQHLIFKMYSGLLVTSISTGIVLGRQAPGESSPIVDLSQYGALDAGISRQHAHLFPDEHGEIFVSDLGSANGTYLNEKRLPKGEAYLVRQNDILRLGKLFMQVNFNADVTDIWTSIVEEISAYQNAQIINSHLQRINNQLHATIVREISSVDIESYWHQLAALETDKTLEQEYDVQPQIIKPEFTPLPELQVNLQASYRHPGYMHSPQVDRVVANDAQDIVREQYQPLISVVIAHPNRLIQLGMKQLFSTDASIRVIDLCSTVDELFELFEKNAVIHVTLLSTEFIEQMTVEQQSIVTILGGRTVAIGNEQRINQTDSVHVWGYLSQTQLLEQAIPCIHATHAGKRFFATGKRDKNATLPDSYDTLTDNEYTALEYFASNYRSREISSLMGVNFEVVEIYRLSIMRKLKLNSKVDLVLFALNNGIISLKQ